MTKKSKALLIVGSLVLIGAVIAAMIINKPHRKAEDEKGMQVTVTELVQAYQNSEPEANKKYLNKTLIVTGTIRESGKNQAGQPTVLFDSEDPMSSVFCTMRDKDLQLQAGSPIALKGFLLWLHYRCAAYGLHFKRKIMLCLYTGYLRLNVKFAM